jgi:ATP-dependent Clp protease, protease subunit
MTNTTQTNNNNGIITGKKRDFILDGKVGEETIRKISENIIALNRYDEEQKENDESYVAKPINVILNTYGGSLYDANMLIGIIGTSQTPIHTYCHGKAMSAGFYIFSAGHKRFATPLATFMYHDGSVGLHNTVEGLKHDVNHMANLRDRYDAFILSRTNIPKQLMDESKRVKEDLYLFAEEAHKYGLVDELLPFGVYTQQV